MLSDWQKRESDVLEHFLLNQGEGEMPEIQMKLPDVQFVFD